MCRALEKDQAQLCILADDCNQPDYKRLIEALCTEKNVDLVRPTCTPHVERTRAEQMGHAIFVSLKLKASLDT
jgi:hypothetical protein